MLNYAICEINGSQIKIVPNKPFVVDLLDDAKELEVKTLVVSDDKGVRIGTPFLDDKIKLTVLENIKLDKIRVAKFHAKANYRRVSGQRPKKTKVVYSLKG